MKKKVFFVIFVALSWKQIKQFFEGESPTLRYIYFECNMDIKRILKFAKNARLTNTA